MYASMLLKRVNQVKFPLKYYSKLGNIHGKMLEQHIVSSSYAQITYSAFHTDNAFKFVRLHYVNIVLQYICDTGNRQHCTCVTDIYITITFNSMCIRWFSWGMKSGSSRNLVGKNNNRITTHWGREKNMDLGFPTQWSACIDYTFLDRNVSFYCFLH